MRSVLRVVLVATVGLASTGCRDEGEQIQPLVNRTEDRRIVVEVAGARRATYDGVVKVKVLSRIGRRQQRSQSVAAIEPQENVSAGGKLTMRPEIGLVGMYVGDGAYTLPAGIGQAPPNGPTVPAPATSGNETMSVAAVVFIDSGPPVSESRFGYLLEPCKVTLNDQGTVGSADCPALVAHNGEKISLKYRWEKP